MTAVVRTYPDAEGSLWIQCPGCDDPHRVALDGPHAWTWDGDEEQPTIYPSILVLGGAPDGVCHSFVSQGAWIFLADSTHALAGQTVPVVPLPEWLRP